MNRGRYVDVRARAEQHGRSVEAEARAILAEAVGRAPTTIVDLVSVDEDLEIELEPGRLGFTARTVGL